MNTKEQFIAHLEANGIHYEKVNGMILFEFEDQYLVAKDFWKKGFRVGIPYALNADERPTNSDKELIRLYLQEQGENGGFSFFKCVELNSDETFNAEEFMRVSNELSNKDFDIDELKQTSAGFIYTFCDAFIGVGKFALSTSAALLRGIANDIDPDDSHVTIEFGEINLN